MASAQPKITLHSLERSRAQRIAWLLEELGLEYAIVPYKRAPPQGLAPPELHAVHPLGKSPVLTIDGVDADDTSAGTPQAGRMVLAESGFIAQYLCEHTNRLLPQKWTPGREGQMGGETDAWRRWMYMLHYAEGSFMPVVVLSLVMSRLRSTAVPFFIRPISRAIANRLAHAWLLPNARQHLAFLADLLARPPAGAAPGPYLCGSELTSADVLLSFPLLAAPELFDGEDAGKTFWDKDGGVKAEFRTVFEYVDGLKQREAWKRADARFAEALGTLEGGQTEGETARL